MKKLFYILFIIIIFASCGRSKNQANAKLDADLHNELMVLFIPPQTGLKNFLIQGTASRRIFVNLPELAKNRVFILPPGDYDISADGYGGTSFSLNEDCSINADGRRFLISTFSEIAFTDGTNFYGEEIVEGRPYYLSIMDLDNKQPQAYAAEITGKGDIAFAPKSANRRIVSAAPYTFLEGEITVNVTLNGDPSKVKPKKFKVLDDDTDAPILDKNGKYYYRSSGTTKPLSFLMSDASGIDKSKTYLKIEGGVPYYPEEDPVLVQRSPRTYRVTIPVPQNIFNGRHDTIKAVLRMTDNDTTHGPSDQSSRDENIVINEQTGPERTFNLTWNGKPLEFAKVHVYSDTKGIRDQMTMREYNNLNFASFTYHNQYYTNKNGTIVLDSVYDNDTVSFFVMKTEQDGTVYSKTVSIGGNTTVTVPVNIPPKGRFTRKLRVTDGAVDDWVNLIQNEVYFKALFYYCPGEEDDTISPERVRSGSAGFQQLIAEPFREGDNIIELSVDLNNISAQTSFNYWCVIEFDNGDSFSMLSTAAEITPSPTLYKR